MIAIDFHRALPAASIADQQTLKRTKREENEKSATSRAHYYLNHPIDLFISRCSFAVAACFREHVRVCAPLNRMNDDDTSRHQQSAD